MGVYLDLSGIIWVVLRISHKEEEEDAMGALARKRFKDNYLASSGMYQGQDCETIANK